VKTGKGEPAVLKFLRTGIARTGLIFKKQMLIPLPSVKKTKFFWGRTVSGRYHTSEN
jgi:hypothetical protein